MIIQQHLRVTISECLRREYVALLGQRESGLQPFIDKLVEEPPISGMQFISISLPQGIQEEDGFIEIFLKRLIQALEKARPEKILRREIERELEKYTNRTVGFQLRMALDNLGWKTAATPLVIILQSLAHAPEEPLRNLLHMLRDYHNQRNMAGEPGKNLRFLAVGDQHLWSLCRNSLRDDESPFGIAKCVFLDGLSYQEIVAFDQSRNFEASIQIQSLTAGIPSFVERVVELSELPDDLSPFFELLEDSWNALPESSRQMLKRLAEGLENFPVCGPGYTCPQIPRVETPWIEAFWKGFLSVQHYELTWRSLIHQAFVMDRMRIRGDRSRSVLVKENLLNRSLRLGEVVKSAPNKENQHKHLEEALLLIVETQDTLLASLLKMLWREEATPTILEKLHRVAENSKKGWIQELDEKITENQSNLTDSLIDAAIWESRRLVGNFDVLFCYNEADIDEVKIIAKKLQEQSILPWLDVWELCPGERWLPELEKQVEHIKTAAVFIGYNGISPLQRAMMDALFNKSLKQEAKIILTILPDVPQEFEISKQDEWPQFLQNRGQVDFRQSDPDPIDQLIWGIKGRRRTRMSS